MHDNEEQQSNNNDNRTPPALELELDGKVIQVPFESARRMLWGVIPAWLKSSEVAPPEPEPGALGFAPGVLMMVRSAFKNLARPFLPQFYQVLYGQKLTIGRQDSMPILIQVLVDFMVLQAARNPIEVVTDGEGHIQSVRPRERTGQTSDATIERVETPS